MSVILLHIGFGKTGSSAIQSWLGRNCKKLKKQSIFYADLDPNAKFNKITSGNGVQLVNAYMKNDEAEQKKVLSQYVNKKAQLCVASTESFHKLKPRHLETLRLHCDELGVEVRVLAYVRSAYEWAYSGYLQAVKRHGATHAFEELERFAMHHQWQVLQRYEEAFNRQVTVKNYDVERSRLLETFAYLLNCDTQKLDMSNPPINRSITFAESEALRLVNSLHDGCFAFDISDHIIYRQPDLQTKVPYVHSVLQRIEEQSTENIAKINQKYFADRADEQVKVHRQDLDQESGLEPTVPDFTGIIDWALTVDVPDGKEKRNFVNFLRDFAIILEESEPKSALAVINRALDLRPDGPFLNKFQRRLVSVLAK